VVEGQIEPETTPELEPAGVTAAPAEEETSSFDELFTWRADVIEVDGQSEEDEEEDSDRTGTKKKKKKKKKFVELEYDPEKQVMVARKKRKRAPGEWDDNWNL
jgi:N utilization substance protein A